MVHCRYCCQGQGTITTADEDDDHKMSGQGTHTNGGKVVFSHRVSGREREFDKML